MYYKNEKQLLFIIKYTLPIFITILSLLITIFLFLENKKDFEKINEEIEKNFINGKKQVIKEQIDNLYNYIIEEQKRTEDNLKNSLNKKVHEAHRIIVNIHEEHAGKHSKDELRSLIKAAIKSIRFNNNRGYFFVYDKKGVNMIHPLLPHIEGKNMAKHQDTKGNYVIGDSLRLLKDQEESYQEWYWRKSKTDMNEYKKIGFVKNIYELDWFIGTGEYVEDFSQDIQKKVLEQIKKLRFGKNSYFIVTDKNNNYISHISENLIGSNAFDELKKLNTKKSFEEIVKMIENNKQGFIELSFFKPRTKNVGKKILYIKEIPNWNWTISTGFYKDDVDQFIKKEKERLSNNYNENIQRLFIISFISTLIFLLISFYISSLIERKFKKYKKDIQREVEKNKKQAELLSQKSKLAAMGEMIENIAHQWRQPLSVISTASTGVRVHKELDSLTDKFLLESIDNITDSANHLSDTIEDFRDFFKPDKAKTTFNIKSAVERALKLINPQLKNHDISIVKNVEEVEIKGFERELLQVLLNIINNSRDALKEVKNKKFIFIDAYKENEKLIIKIQDSGTGMKESIIQRVFEPYFTTKHKSQGTGIGLYMSQEIIARHMNGKITAQNSSYKYEEKEYKGALFTIELPIKIN